MYSGCFGERLHKIWFFNIYLFVHRLRARSGQIGRTDRQARRKPNAAFRVFFIFIAMLKTPAQ